MLAGDLFEVFERRYPKTQIHPLSRAELDITSRASVEAALSKYDPAWVVNSAAYTNVDGAESERDLAESINAVGPAILAQACVRRGAKLIHFSTDQVFDGKTDRPRTEEELPNPLNHYAASKLRGEQSVLENDHALVLRVQWLYGKRKDRFTPLRAKTVFTPFADQFGAPTWTAKIAGTLADLLEKDARGLFHFSYDDWASWAEVFEFVKTEWNLPLALQPKRTAEVKLPAARPLFSVLANDKLKRVLGVPTMGSWKAPLREFLASVGVAFAPQIP